MAEIAEVDDGEQEARPPHMEDLIALIKLDDAGSASSGSTFSSFSTVPSPFGGDAPLMWKPVFGRGVYGGQLFAQSLHAAWATVPADFVLHAAQAHFLLRVRPDAHVLYRVAHVRDGATYSLRNVVGLQSGAAVYTCFASFARGRESHTHALSVHAPRDTPTPASLLSLSEAASGMHVKYCRHGEPDAACTLPRQRVWLRTRVACARPGAATRVDDAQLRTLALAYMSDIAILSTSVLPFGYPRVPMHMMATLSHALYMHASDDAAVQPEREWTLYDTEGVSMARSRGFAVGRLYSQAGVLLASTVQEGVVRLAVEEEGQGHQLVQHRFTRSVVYSPYEPEGEEEQGRPRL